jgi:hypothetical protein
MVPIQFCLVGGCFVLYGCTSSGITAFSAAGVFSVLFTSPQHCSAISAFARNNHISYFVVNGSKLVGNICTFPFLVFR